MNERSLHIQTMKNEQDFIDYHYSYTELKRKENKILEYIYSLKRQINIYQEAIKEFNSETNKIIEKVKEEYNVLINLQFKEDMEQLGKSSFYRKTVDRTLGSITTKHIGGGSGKMNLINMLVQNEKSRLLDNGRTSYLNRKKNNKNETSKLNEEQHMRGDEPNLNLVVGIDPNSKNVFIFDKTSKKKSKVNLNFQGSPIVKFLNCFSTLNYNGRFYLSGGFQQPKAFLKIKLRH